MKRDSTISLCWPQIDISLTGSAHGQARVSASLSEDGNVVVYAVIMYEI